MIRSTRRVNGSVLKSCVLAARPKTLPAALVPVWAGCVLAWKLTGKFDGRLAFFTIAAALCIQIATNFFNDAIDAEKGADGKNRLGPVRVTASGLLSARVVMLAAAGFLLVAAMFGFLMFRERGWPVLAIGIPSLFLAYGYTGGPFPLAYRGLGELFVVIFFGLIAVAGTVFIQTGGWPREAFLLGAQVGLLSAVLISINNFRDRAEDTLSGKHTIAVRYGPKAAAGLIWLEIKLAAFLGLGWLAFGQPVLVLASLPVLAIGMRIIWGVFTSPVDRSFNRFLALAGVQLVLFGAAFHLASAFSRHDFTP